MENCLWLSKIALNAITDVLMRGRQRKISHRKREIHTGETEGGGVQPTPSLWPVECWFWVSSLPNCEKINIFCFNPPVVQEVVISKKENYFHLSMVMICLYHGIHFDKEWIYFLAHKLWL